MIALDERDVATQLRDLLRVRASLTGEDVVVRFSGEIHAMLPGERARHLFSFDGYNIARAVPADDGWDLLAREAVFYLDPVTKQVLDVWRSPFDDVERPVVHVTNDPVNFQLRPVGPHGAFELPTTVLDDVVVLTSDIFLTYPSPLPRSEFPHNSAGDLYQAAELFQYFCRLDDLRGDAPDVPMQVSWTRIAPWVPFMGMGDRPGQLVYHCAGHKVAAGFDGLPSWMRDRVAQQWPRFATAPESFESPNETSWTFFLQQHPEGTP